MSLDRDRQTVDPPVPEEREGQTTPLPPGLWAQTKVTFAGRSAKIALLIVVILLLVFGVVMVISVDSMSKGPGATGPHATPTTAAATPGGRSTPRSRFL